MLPNATLLSLTHTRLGEEWQPQTGSLISSVYSCYRPAERCRLLKSFKVIVKIAKPSRYHH